ncbi:Hypothetical protein A7982_02676 [Minicystis rosea]|nr:Hypothetical protein A7982_02676 [Minicystis rosea]
MDEDPPNDGSEDAPDMPDPRSRGAHLFFADMNINFARLNHILIPSTKAGRDRFRDSSLGRLIAPIGWSYSALTDEGRVLAMASVVVGAFGLDVQSTVVYLLWSALSALLLASLVLTAFHRPRDLRLTVSAPRRVTVGEPLTFTLMLHNDGPRDRLAVRIDGPFLPWDGSFATPAPRVDRVPAGGSVRVDIAARFSARGEHHLDAFSAALLVPFGFAQGRGARSGGVKFMVVPRLANVTRVTTPPGTRYQTGGVALASKTGEAMDLLGVRPYRAGDPVRHLHARSWARAGEPVVREYQEEYFSRIGVIVETTLGDARRLEAILSLAAGIVAHLSRGEALIDLLVVGDHVHELTIGRSLGFLDQALDLLACVEPERRRPDPTALAARLRPHLGRLSCVIVVASSWDGGALAEQIRGAGVGCVTVLVGAGEGTAPRATGVHSVTVAAVEKGEALAF